MTKRRKRALLVALSLLSSAAIVVVTQPLAAFRVLAWIFPRILWRVETKAPLVALTFDDGPAPDHTPQVLDILARRQAHATFFLIGERAAAHRQPLSHGPFDIPRFRDRVRLEPGADGADPRPPWPAEAVSSSGRADPPIATDEGPRAGLYLRPRVGLPLRPGASALVLHSLARYEEPGSGRHRRPPRRDHRSLANGRRPRGNPRGRPGEGPALRDRVGAARRIVNDARPTSS